LGAFKLREEETEMIAVIDNYDSFTYNLVQYLGELGCEVSVFRNDQVTVDELASTGLEQIVISPGPGTPNDSGVSNDVIRYFHQSIPILGVCLGHQCIAHVFGGQVSRAPRLMHGKTSTIHHTGTGIFADLPTAFVATRYHSLIVQEPLPDSLELTAFTDVGEVMGIQHRHHPTYGVQFHPESILTPDGKQLLQNFVSRSRSNPHKGVNNGH
jgi:anthranilate synthase/aminodeoxychorismate synthase-like glutamine amidotransferase